jgi:hypothetical protein
MTKSYIHLGRYGDIINTLPLLRLVAEQHGPVKQVVSGRYADVLDGVSYVEPVVFEGPFEDLTGAMAMAYHVGLKAVNLQVYGHGYSQQRHTGSFVHEQWRNAGMVQHWGAPLVFDRRDAAREAALVAAVRRTGSRGLGRTGINAVDARGYPQMGKMHSLPLVNAVGGDGMRAADSADDADFSLATARGARAGDVDKPLVLVASHGFSSPFAQGKALLQELVERHGHHATVVDLSTVHAHRIYDLLGLMDAAACLVTIDTAHMHLAHGSRVPVVALSTPGPTPWHGAAKRAGHVWYGKYNELERRKAELLETVATCIAAAERAAVPVMPLREAREVITVDGPRILHTYPIYAMGADALRRHRTAVESWDRNRDERWVDVPVAPEALRRSSRGIGDARDLPYLRDVVDRAVAQSTREDDVILYTNSDVCLVEGLGSEILAAAQRHGAFFTHRWDFVRPVSTVRRHTIATGRWYPGSDAFGFTVAWWREHGHRYPDMLVGAEFVDCVLRQLIKKVCGKEAEVHHAVYHEKHLSHWEQQRGNAANLHNQALAQRWFSERGTDDLDPFSPEEAERIRQRRRLRQTQRA